MAFPACFRAFGAWKALNPRIFGLCRMKGQKNRAASIRPGKKIFLSYESVILLHFLETVVAVHRSAVYRTERNLGICTALSAHGLEHLSGRSGTGIPITAGRSAVPAAFRFVFKTLFSIKLLFTRSKNELITAILTYQNSVFKHVTMIPHFFDFPETMKSLCLLFPVSESYYTLPA